MKFSIMLLMPVRRCDGAGDVLRATAGRVQLAERLGYSRVWLTENHFSDWGACPSPLVLAAFLAAHTDVIRIGTGVVVLPRYDALALAEDVAMVDQLSGGRLDLGIGRGYEATMLRAFGLGADDTEAALLAGHADLVAHLAGRREPTISPGPRQRPHPPLFVATSHNPTILGFAAQHGHGLMLASAGRRLDENLAVWRASTTSQPLGPCVVSRGIHVAADRETALAEAGTALAWYAEQAHRTRPGATGNPLPPEALLGTFCLYGPPADTIAALQHLADLGVSEVACSFDLGGVAEALVERSMRRFAEEIMPAFDRDDAARRVAS